MNKSACERLTGCSLRKVGPGEWALFERGVAEPVLVAKGYKDASTIQRVHDDFWRNRRQEVFKRDGFKCVECKSPFHIECDHIENRSQGGNHSMENLQTLCRDCHYHKTNLLGKWAKRKNA